MKVNWLIAPDTLDRLEGLNARYVLLSKRLEEVQDQAAAFDRAPNPGELEKFEGLRRKLKSEVTALLEELLTELKAK